MKHRFFLVFSFYVNFFTAWLPDAPMTMRLRGFFYSLCMQRCGKNFQVASGTILRGVEFLDVGDNVYVGPGTILILRCGCKIEDNVLIGPNCVITDGNHGFDGHSYRYAQGKQGAISIGAGAWLAANCVVTQSSTIGERTVVGANSTVVGVLEDDSIYVSGKAQLFSPSNSS